MQWFIASYSRIQNLVSNLLHYQEVKLCFYVTFRSETVRYNMVNATNNFESTWLIKQLTLRAH